MEYFRRYLIFLRKHENLNELKFKVSTMTLIASIVGIILGFLMDLLLPHGYFTNMFRGVLAVATGLTLFSFSYLASVKRTDKKISSDRFYKTARARFSHRQRVNFSIAVGSIVLAFVLLSNSEGLSFTLKAILAVFITLVLIAFSRQNRSEFIKDIHEIPDVRDLEHKATMVKSAEKRKSKSNDKPKKKLWKL